MVEVEKVIESKRAFKGRRVSLRVDTVELPSGRKTTREIVEYPDCVVIVAIDSEENVLLVRQYRSAIGRTLMELPAGKTEPDEHPLKAAHRELREETGYSARNMEELGGFYSGPGYSTEYLHLYLATELEPTGEALDPDEIMNIFRVPLAEIPGIIARGEVCDAKSVAGLLRVILQKK
ncbi:MAG: NUDIX hydrolase [Chloroflexi bacterium]|nr:NUDIX hydrolase [Chloroflexota bacterium]